MDNLEKLEQLERTTAEARNMVKAVHNTIDTFMDDKAFLRAEGIEEQRDDCLRIADKLRKARSHEDIVPPFLMPELAQIESVLRKSHKTLGDIVTVITR